MNEYIHHKTKKLQQSAAHRSIQPKGKIQLKDYRPSSIVQRKINEGIIKQGRVKPTMQMKGKVNINDDKSLEKEAEVMGAKANQPNSSYLNTQQKATAIQRSPVVQLIKFSDTQAGLMFARDIDANSIQMDTVLVLAGTFPDAMIEDGGFGTSERHVNFWRGTPKFVRLTQNESRIIHDKANERIQYLDKKVAENPNTLLAFPGNLQSRHERLSDKTVRKANRIAGLIRQKYAMDASVTAVVFALEDYVVHNNNPVPAVVQVISNNNNPVIPLRSLEFNKFLISTLRNFDGLPIPNLGHLEQMVELQEREIQKRKFKKVIAHRGDGATFDKMGGLLPRAEHNYVYQHENENSAESTRKAMESWTQPFSFLSGIECDVYLTQDNVPIVTHTAHIDALLQQEAGNPFFRLFQADIHTMLASAINPRFMKLTDWLTLIEGYVIRKEQQPGILPETIGKLRIEIEMKQQGLMNDPAHPENWRSTEKIVSQFLKRSGVSHLMDIALFNNSNLPLARHRTAKKKTTLSQVTYAKGGAPDPELKEVRFGMHQKGISAHIDSGALDDKIVTFAPGLDHPGGFTLDRQLLPVHGLPTQLDVTIEQSIQSARHKTLTERMEQRKQSGQGTGPTAIHTLTDHGHTGAVQILFTSGLTVANSLQEPFGWTTDAIIGKHPELTDEFLRRVVAHARSQNNARLIGELLIQHVPALL